VAADTLKLTDFMDLAALQEMQDGFAAIASVQAVITDAGGNVLTSLAPATSFLHRRDAIAQQEEEVPEPQRVGREYVAPITVGKNKLGHIRMRGGSDSVQLDEAKAAKLAQKFNLDPQLVRDLVSAATKDRNRRPASIQFLFLLANAIARLCYQEYQLRHRIIELETLSRVTTMLAQSTDLNQVLHRAVEIVTELLEAKACSIRLIDLNKDELKISAVYNLSNEYLTKGKIKFSSASIDQEALSDVGYSYVPDMQTDPRVQHHDIVMREGIVSLVTVGMKSRGDPIGVLRVYSGTTREFTEAEIQLLRGIASTAASAIESARLVQHQAEARELEAQINMAADVQQRMIPKTAPALPGLDVATVYVPCYQLGGDLYDFIELPYDNLGVVIADVSGKGLPASLIMASVRAALRAQVDNVYYLGEVMQRLNSMLVRDTRATEFVTLFYGVLDLTNKRLTFSNAGHLPCMLLRENEITELGAGDQGSIVLGVIEGERYRQSFTDLHVGDVLLFYTDGLSEARNAEQELYGRQRIAMSLKKGGENSNAIAQSILLDLRAFTQGTEPSDDCTIVVLRITE